MFGTLCRSSCVVLTLALAACAGGPAAAPSPAASAPVTTAKPAAVASPSSPLPYPPTRAVDVSEQRFGLTIRDPYRWLEDGSSPEVQAWVNAQDKLARDELAKLPGREAIAARLRGLVYREWTNPPLKRGGRAFYSRKEATGEKRKIFWRQGGKGEERVLLDPEAFEPGKSVGLGFWSPSYDGKKVAYVAHPENADAGFLHVKDVTSGRENAVDVIGGAKYARPLWTPKGDGFYYVGLPTEGAIPGDQLPGHSEVKFHRLGAAPATDEVVFPKNGNAETELAAKLSRDGHWLLVSVIRGASIIELHYRDLRRPGSPWVALVKGHDGAMDAVAWKDQIYLRTSEGAPNGRVFRVDPAKPARDQWREIVPEDQGAALEDATVLGGRLVLTYARQAKSEFEIRALDGAKQGAGAIKLPGIGTTYGLFGEPDEDIAYYPFTSFTEPPAIYELSLKTGASKLWYASKAPVAPAAYETEQLFYPSKDGTKVSMFVVRRKGAPRDGSMPFWLTGYGGFSSNVTPSFEEMFYVWLELGGGVAMPNLRGGAEYGEAWHRGGMLEKKQNTFDDFIAAAEYLVRERYTRPERLAIEGASNGGLLVGAAITQRPELFRAALCAVPVLDMVRYPLFGDGKTWIDEYGSPDNPALLRALLGYSPYHHVKAGAPYPAVLMLSAEADDRVAPLHAWKTTAALQAASASGRPVLMRVERHAGHGGAAQTKSTVELGTDMLSFALHAVGVEPRFAGAP